MCGTCRTRNFCIDLCKFFGPHVLHEIELSVVWKNDCFNLKSPVNRTKKELRHAESFPQTNTKKTFTIFWSTWVKIDGNFLQKIFKFPVLILKVQVSLSRVEVTSGQFRSSLSLEILINYWYQGLTSWLWTVLNNMVASKMKVTACVKEN